MSRLAPVGKFAHLAGVSWAIKTALALAVVCGGGLLCMRPWANPDVVLLVSHDNAQWIQLDSPFDAAPKFDPASAARFETSFTVAPGASGAVIRVIALRRVQVNLDGKKIFDSGRDLDHWKTAYRVPLPAEVPAGRHVLEFDVSNLGGPSLLRVNCPELNLLSDDRWLASDDGRHWRPAVPANRPFHVPLPPQFHSTIQDLIRLSPLLISLFLIGCALIGRRPSKVDWGSRVRWLLLIAWCVLAINNIMKVNLEYGYDADQHSLYIRYVSDHLSLPRPDGGWQFFQAPLYYILSAAWQRLLLLFGVAETTAPYLLRLIPLACGGAIIEISYRCARLVFPGRSDLQAIATAIGGLLPVNIYMAQAVSNEPMGAVMSGLLVLISLRFINSPAEVLSPKALVIAGLTVGLALLTKVNTVILFFPAGAAMAFALLRTRARPREWFRSTGIISGVALLICGWFLLRNFILIGKPFFLESSITRSQWWQAPGYRTPRMFLEFGEVFSQPIYSGVNSIWDCLYGTLWANGILIGRQSWNFGLMSCGLWLALVPMLAIFAGIVRAIATRNASILFAAAVVVCFVLAISYVYLTLPIYSCAKASYMLGAAPCLGLLAASGLDKLMLQRAPRAMVGSAIFCWAVVAYFTYFAA